MQKSKYWNLMEAAAWVMYRDMRFVDRFAPPDPYHWGTFILFPPKKDGDTGGRQDEGDVKDKGDAKDPSNEEEESKVQVGDKDKANHDEQLEHRKSNANPIEPVAPYRDLFDALRLGLLQAEGQRQELGSPVEPIPVAEWDGLVEDPAGPYRRLPSGRQEFPWRNIRVLRADVERHWRSPIEVEARTKHPWDTLKQIHDELRANNPGWGVNRMIYEIQLEYEKRIKREPPVRSSIQRHMKRW